MKDALKTFFLVWGFILVLAIVFGVLFKCAWLLFSFGWNLL